MVRQALDSRILQVVLAVMADTAPTDTGLEVATAQTDTRATLERTVMAPPLAVLEALVAMVDSILNLRSSLLLHPPDHRPRSAGAIGQIEIDSNSRHSLPRGHGREMERQIGGR